MSSVGCAFLALCALATGFMLLSWWSAARRGEVAALGRGRNLVGLACGVLSGALAVAFEHAGSQRLLTVVVFGLLVAPISVGLANLRQGGGKGE